MTTKVRTQFITDGQIGQINDRLATKLRKFGLPPESVQKVLMMPGNVAIDEMIAVFRKHVEVHNDIIVRRVRVNRTRSAMEAINATGRRKYCTDSLVAGMPQGKGDEVEVCFFKLGHDISDADLDKEYDLRGLKLVDPCSLVAVNEADPAFADKHPNVTHWEDTNGNFCFAGFSRGFGAERRVFAGRRLCGGWGDHWWFAGIRK